MGSAVPPARQGGTGGRGTGWNAQTPFCPPHSLWDQGAEFAGGGWAAKRGRVAGAASLQSPCVVLVSAVVPPVRASPWHAAAAGAAARTAHLMPTHSHVSATAGRRPRPLLRPALKGYYCPARPPRA